MKSIVVLTLVGLVALANCKPVGEKLDNQKETVNVNKTTAMASGGVYTDCNTMVRGGVKQGERKVKEHEHSCEEVPSAVPSVDGGTAKRLTILEACNGCDQNLKLLQCRKCNKYLHYSLYKKANLNVNKEYLEAHPLGVPQFPVMAT